MKAIRVRAFGGPEALGQEDIPIPAPGPGQVLVRVRATGVNPVDTYIRTGTHAIKPALPYTPGTDMAGVVETLGEGVTSWKPGDRVYADGVGPTSGTYAEFTVCQATNIHRLPDRVSFAQGAALGVPYATAWRALFRQGQAKPGETVLVHGASGGVGTAAVQIARSHGLRVIGTAGTDAGLALAKASGAHVVINHRDAGYDWQIMDATGSRGVDVVIEMLANVNLDRDLDLLAQGGRVVVVGNRGRVEIDPRKAMKKDGSIYGLMIFNAREDELPGIHAGILAGLENGSLTPVVGREMPLADAAKAHVAVMEAGALGKIVLLP